MTDTEKRNPKTTHIDRMSTEKMVEIMCEADLVACNAVRNAGKNIAAAIDAILPKMRKGGRLFYIGAGTSGRIGVMDASECPPTYGVSPDTVIGIIAGGDRALRNAIENVEDSAEMGKSDLESRNLSENDSVIAISASGNAEYVCSALEYARSLGCVTVSVTSNRDGAMIKYADVSIVTETGPEVITGSTRMNAGTAQKLVLNKISTSLMVKLGYVYENLMINLKPTNIKLKDRMTRIVSEITGCPYEDSRESLENNGWVIRDAVNAIKGAE